VSEAREAVLARIRRALADVPAGEETVVPRDYRERGAASPDELVERFAERAADYRATVETTTDPAQAASEALREADARRVVVAPDLPGELRPGGVELVEDDGLGPHELDAIDAVLTTCAVACADTGTIALDGGPGQGRRAIALVPDVHVCIVHAEQIVETVPELVSELADSVRAHRPIVLVSGPSATSDIELNRVEGVHGPRTLIVLIATPLRRARGSRASAG
jgi:L-lactate dehydrogenase complex protein LldG